MECHRYPCVHEYCVPITITMHSVQDVPSELYGPMMLTLSLVAVLLYGMKSSGHEVVRSDVYVCVCVYSIHSWPYLLILYQEEGTLIGTAFAFCFGYWLGVSSLVFFIAYIVDAHLSAIQMFSLIVSLIIIIIIKQV